MTAGTAARRRLLLVEPPFYRLYGGGYALVRLPLSLAYLAQAASENTHWDVAAYNADFAPHSEPFDITHLTGEGFACFRRSLRDLDGEVWRTVRGALAEHRPAVLGLSVKSSTLEAALSVARLAKASDPRTLVVAGGPHPSATGGQMLLDPAVDVCVLGEGEATLVELLRALERGEPLERVRGLVVRRGARVTGTPPRAPLADLDALGFPARHAPETLLGFADYPPQAFAHLMATRGCPMNCLFCGSRDVWGRRTRFRSPEHVAAEVDHLRRSMGMSSFHFDDDTFGVTRAYLGRLCHALAGLDPPVAWSCEIHVRLVDDQTIAQMKRAGCHTVQLGIESGDDAILRRIRKGFTVEQALEAARVIAAQGVRLHTFFMGGFPWETEQTLRRTHEVIRRLDCEKVVYSLFTPYPGSEAYDLCRRLGLVPEGHDHSLFGHQSPLNCFSLHLAPARFRALSREIEETVAAKNRAGRRQPPPCPR